MSKIQNYYLITNRNKDFPTTVDKRNLRYFYAPVSGGGYQPADSSEAWIKMLQADIANSGTGEAGLFIHGYGVTWKNVQSVSTKYFDKLTGVGGYPSVLIAFDWPSDDVKLDQSEAFQKAKDKAQKTSTVSFPMVKDVLDKVNGTNGTSFSALSHSMGNYLMHLGTQDHSLDKYFDNILCVAAMLEDNSFNIDQSVNTPCKAVADAAKEVTFYYSTYDNVLPYAEKPKFDGYPELGVRGPRTGSALISGVTDKNCSNVVNKENAETYGAPQIHTSYFYIPEMLKELSTALQGKSAASAGQTS